MQRVITGAILLVFAALMIAVGGLTVGIVVSVCLLIAVHEELKALKIAGHHPMEWPIWVISVVGLPIIHVLGDKSVMPMVLLACLACAVCEVFRRDYEPNLIDMMMSMLPMFHLVLPCMGIMCVSRVEPVTLQRTLMCMILVVPILGDTLAYFVGSRVRGPKLCPAVSPKKTISGAIAGLVGSALGALLVGAVAYIVSPQITLELTGELLDEAGNAITEVVAMGKGLPSWWKIMLIGLVGGVASQMGDLFASLIKRHAGIKDFSNLFPGHGGMLDRLDSILFMALVIYSIRLLV